MAERLVARNLEEHGAPSGPSDSGVPAISDIKKDLKFLERVWQRIKAFLSDQEEAEIRTKSGRLRMRELRDLAYQIDDLLDSYKYDKLAREIEGIGLENHGADVSWKRKRTGGEDELYGSEDELDELSGSEDELYGSEDELSGSEDELYGSEADPAFCDRPERTEPALHTSYGGGEDPLEDPSYRCQLAAGIKKIKERLDEISSQNHALKLTDCDVISKQKDRLDSMPQTGSLPTDRVFCGREEELKALVQLLLKPSDACGHHGLDVIAVVGMGGVGKTTLAQHAYNDLDVSDYFDLKGWVCVSELFDVVKLTRQIAAEAFGKSDCSGFQQLATVQGAITEAVQGKKFFLVMDNVWNEKFDNWDKFWPPFRYGAKGSKILITTRNQAVADSASAAKSLPLQHLSEEDGLLLFKQHAFFNRTERPELVEIGSAIVRKCKGLPLAIKELACRLYWRLDNESENVEAERWRSVLESDLCDTESMENSGGKDELAESDPGKTTGSLVTDTVFCGREKELPQLVQLLLNPSDACGHQGLDVIAVVGMGGVGKTTLAQKAYNHPEVSKQFATKGWVCVSEHFDELKLTKDVAQAFGKSDCSGFQQLAIVQDALVDAVRDKKFLLVMDDVWNEDCGLWDKFWPPFRFGAKGSKILITTRNQAVADSASAAKSLPLQHLSDEDGMRLFKQHAFFNRTERPQLVTIGSEIVKKCKGLPLAIKVLARLLYQRPSNEPEHEEEKRWRSVLASDLCDMENKGCGGQILGPLLLSYLRLPPHIRPLFASCSMFPKDYKIPKDLLVSIWIANGLIKDDDEERSRETGLRYIESLTSRSLLQLQPSEDDEGEDDVKMHDLIHDLAQHVCGEEYHSTYIWEPSDWNVPAHARHLFIVVGEITPDVIQSLACQLPNRLRTLILSSGYEERNVTVPRIEKLQCLRALDLRGISPDVYFAKDFFGNTKNLRLIYPNGSVFAEIPESVYRLYHLQRLDLSESGVNHLSDSIGNLKSLRHLDLSCTSIDKLPESIGNLKSLVHLDLRESTRIDKLPESIGNLKSLVHLDLRESIMIDKLPESIGNLKSLVHLDLSYTYIKELPESIGNLKSLVHLDLSYTKIEKLPESIGNLESLRHLDLSSNEIVWKLPDSIVELKNLEELNLEYCCNLGELPKGIVNLTNLRVLNIKDCFFYLPAGISRLTSLELIGNFPVGHTTEDGAAITELKELKCLRDADLQIRYLSEVTKKTYAECILAHQSSLQDLTLDWGSDIEEEDSDVNLTLGWGSDTEEEDSDVKERVLQSLKPHTNLSILRIYKYGGARVSSWIGDPSFTNLSHLKLYDFQRCAILPPLSKLPSLSVLEIGYMPLLEKVDSEQAHFPKLKELKISICPKLICLSISAPSLEAFSLDGCGSLTSISLFVSSPLSRLKISNCSSLKGIKIEPLFVPSRKLPLFHLKLDHCDSLESFPLYEYPTIDDLRVVRCKFMERLDFGVHLLFGQPLFTYSLKHLMIDDCPRLSFTPTTQLPPSMEKLCVAGCPSLEEWCRRYKDTKLANIMYFEEASDFYRSCGWSYID